MSEIELEGLPAELGRSAVSIGMFDGVHLGHRSLLAVLRGLAGQLEVPAVVLTFDRHPAELLAPDRAPRYINTPEQRVRLLKEAGADQVVVARFDHAIADLTPEGFVDVVLFGGLRAAAAVVGANFRFGRKRAGDVERLRALGAERDCRVVSVEPTIVHGAPVSSTRVRNAIARGEVGAAADLLGRPFTMLGRVVPGLGLGRQLGYPTANVQVGSRQIVPPDGVYAVRVLLAGTAWRGACSIGTRPTVDGTERSIEVFIDGFEGDLYDEEIGTAFCRRLRDQIKFDSLEGLRSQIEKDVAAARGSLE